MIELTKLDWTQVEQIADESEVQTVVVMRSGKWFSVAESYDDVVRMVETARGEWQ